MRGPLPARTQLVPGRTLTRPRKRIPLRTSYQRPSKGEPLGRHTLDKLELVQRSTEFSGADSQKYARLGPGMCILAVNFPSEDSAIFQVHN